MPASHSQDGPGCKHAKEFLNPALRVTYVVYQEPAPDEVETVVREGELCCVQTDHRPGSAFLDVLEHPEHEIPVNDQPRGIDTDHRRGPAPQIECPLGLLLPNPVCNDPCLC